MLRYSAPGTCPAQTEAAASLFVPAFATKNRLSYYTQFREHRELSAEKPVP